MRLHYRRRTGGASFNVGQHDVLMNPSVHQCPQARVTKIDSHQWASFDAILCFPHELHHRTEGWIFLSCLSLTACVVPFPGLEKYGWYYPEIAWIGPPERNMPVHYFDTKSECEQVWRTERPDSRDTECRSVTRNSCARLYFDHEDDCVEHWSEQLDRSPDQTHCMLAIVSRDQIID